jgi:hypothetical protein
MLVIASAYLNGPHNCARWLVSTTRHCILETMRFFTLMFQATLFPTGQYWLFRQILRENFTIYCNLRGHLKLLSIYFSVELHGRQQNVRAMTTLELNPGTLLKTKFSSLILTIWFRFKFAWFSRSVRQQRQSCNVMVNFSETTSAPNIEKVIRK